MLLAAATAPQVEMLWPNGAPGALGSDESDRPSLTIYLPALNGAQSAVIVCPGGGYGMLAVDHEGRQIAEWLNARGVAAFVLRYRLGPRYHHPIELGDAQRALRGEPPPIAVSLPNDPRLHVTVRAHDLRDYEQLTTESTDEHKPAERAVKP